MITVGDIQRADLSSTIVVHSYEITVGALSRRHARIELDTNGYNYKEYKGVLDSVFVVSGRMTCGKFLALADWVKANSA